MRRRRHVLQVSTFPFLAVLLCTMGSLILILLVIDRRAKLAASAEANGPSSGPTMSAKAAREAREAWERQRAALHARLAEEEDALVTQQQAVTDHVQQTSAEMERQRLHRGAAPQGPGGTGTPASESRRAEERARSGSAKSRRDGSIPFRAGAA